MIGHNTRKHGKSPTYQSWANMKSRCSNPNFPKYEYYGGKGIAVCDEWLFFENFLKDMSERPEGMTLDRIDSNKNYELSNCKWSTQLEQVRNTTSNKLDAERVIQIRKLRKETGMTYKALAEQFNSTYHAVRAACSGRTWQEV